MPRRRSGGTARAALRRRVIKVAVTRAQKDFERVVILARRADVAITRRGRTIAYVLSIARYRQLVAQARRMRLAVVRT